MSFIPIKPVAPFIHVRVPVPTDFTEKKQKVSSTVEGLIVDTSPELTVLESERITSLTSFYSGMSTVTDNKGQKSTRKVNFAIPKIVQVVKDNQDARYQEGQFLVLTHWTNMSDVVLDDEKKYMYLMIEEKYISGIVEKQEDGEAIFKCYFDNIVEDTLENIEARVAEVKAIDEQDRINREAKAAMVNTTKRGTSNSALAGSRPATSGLPSGFQIAVPGTPNL